jgi:protein SCO1/2
MTTIVAAQPTRSAKWLVRLLYVFLGALVVSVLAFSLFKPLKVLPRVSLAPGFVFTDQTGARKTSDDYRGKLTIYNFTYTGCGAGCPQTSKFMQVLRERLTQIKTSDAPFALVTISLDPEHDTPAALKSYAAQFEPAQPSPISWEWLTGDALLTKYVVGGGFSVYYEKPDDLAGTSIHFDPHYVLVDGAGIIRAEYRSADPDIERVMSDINILIDEVHNSQGAGRLAYEAAHLFRCYP